MTGLGGDDDFAGVTFDDVATDGQAKAQAAPVFFGGEKWFKHFGEDFGWHPHAVVAHFNLNIVGIGSAAGGEKKIAAIGHGVDGINDECQHNLFDLSLIATNEQPDQDSTADAIRCFSASIGAEQVERNGRGWR